MTLRKAPEDVPDWQLERFVLGELAHEESEAIKQALDEREDMRARLAALERSNVEILARHPPSAVAAQVRARLGNGSRATKTKRTRLVLTLAASVAAVTSGIALRSVARAPGNGGDVTRVKGLEPQLLLFRKGPASQVEQLPEGSVARDHDLVQVAYQAAGRRYGVVVSIDGRGVVTRHLPPAGEHAAFLKAGAPVPLPDAYELDDAPGFERFYLVTADEEFPVEMVVAAVRDRQTSGARAGEDPLDLPPVMEQSSFVLRKEPQR